MENFSPIFFCFWRDGIWPVILSPIRWIVPHWTSEISAQPVGVNSSDPDLELRRGQEGGAGHLKPEIREGRSPKIFFGPSGLSLVIKMRGEGGLGGGVFLSPGSASRCKKRDVRVTFTANADLNLYHVTKFPSSFTVTYFYQKDRFDGKLKPP